MVTLSRCSNYCQSASILFLALCSDHIFLHMSTLRLRSMASTFAVLCLVMVSCCTRTDTGASQSATVPTYQELSLDDRERVEAILKLLGDVSEKNSNEHKEPWWAVDLKSLLGREPSLRTVLYWPRDRGSISFVVPEHSRYGLDGKRFAATLSPPRLWVVAYLRPDVLGNTRTAVLTGSGTTMWISPEELDAALQTVNEFCIRAHDQLKQLGGGAGS